MRKATGGVGRIYIRMVGEFQSFSTNGVDAFLRDRNPGPAEFRLLAFYEKTPRAIFASMHKLRII